MSFCNRGRPMRALAFLALSVSCSALAIPAAEAQVSVNIGVAPDCPYGYYDVAPYGCAPAGYYGPEWFSGGVFIGAGPWFHGPANFHGNVDNRFHPDHGYHGPVPNRGDRAEPARRVDQAHFKGNEVRDGRGHVAEGRH
jgi:hypothetical protein